MPKEIRLGLGSMCCIVLGLLWLTAGYTVYRLLLQLLEASSVRQIISKNCYQ